MSNNNGFFNRLTSFFTRKQEVKEKDKIHGSSLKEKYNNARDRFDKVGSPFRVAFYTVYDTVWNVVLFLIVTLSLFGIFGGAIGLGYIAALVNDHEIQTAEEMKQSLTEMTESTTVSFGSGEEIGTLRTDLVREKITYDEMSPYLIDALIATEDEYFYEHNGMVPKAFIRASLQQVVSDNTTGGSTITQQLIKNQLLTTDTTFDRKATEILLSFRVEKLLEKDEILEAYLNQVSFGRNANGQNIAGVEAAAQGIFGISANELNIAQAAFIAGMPQNPYAYTPFTQLGEVKDQDYLEPGLQRLSYVLNRMHTEGMITDEEYEEAQNYDIIGNLTTRVETPNELYPHLTDEIERRTVQILKYVLAEEDGLDRSDVDNTPLINEEYTIRANSALRNQGYQITTTIDKEIYDTMQQIKDDSPYYYGERSSAEALDAQPGQTEEMLQHEIGVILKNNKTGAIIGFVGGRDFERSAINHATMTKRQAGSIMKPLAAYAPAIDKGLIVPDTVLLDQKFEITHEGWAPTNYDAENEYGLVTAYHALTNSFNLSTLRLWSQVKSERPQDYLTQVGIDIPLNQYADLERTTLVDSFALGSLDMSVEESVDAFSSLANNGMFADSYMIETITGPDGEVVYQHEVEPIRVWEDSTAYLTSEILENVFREGSAYYISDYYDQVSGTYDWAGKTGTTDSFVDSWFTAYNPEVTLGVWMGYDQRIPQVYETYQEERHHIYAWREFASRLSEVNPELMGANQFRSQPSSVSQVRFCALTMELESDCDTLYDRVITGLVANNTLLEPKENITDYRIQERLGAGFYGISPALNVSHYQGQVRQDWSRTYTIGSSSSSQSDNANNGNQQETEQSGDDGTEDGSW